MREVKDEKCERPCHMSHSDYIIAILPVMDGHETRYWVGSSDSFFDEWSINPDLALPFDFYYASVFRDKLRLRPDVSEVQREYIVVTTRSNLSVRGGSA